MSKRPPDPTALGRAFRRRLRRAGAGGPPVLGCMVSEYLRPSLATLLAEAGYDFVFVETEHAFLQTPELAGFVHAARGLGLPAIAKTGLDRGEVTRLLDAGLCGLQLPRTESPEQLAELAEYALFPPKGSRAGAPGYASTDYRIPEDHAAWLRRANQSVSLVAHIETTEGFHNAAAIVASPHVDVVYVGPYDFSIAMGRPGDYDHPDVTGPMRRILRLCRERQVCFGTTPSGPETARDWVRRGAGFFELGSELELLAQGARAEVEAYGGSLISSPGSSNRRENPFAIR